MASVVIKFPEAYPNRVAPTFELVEATSLSDKDQTYVLGSLKEVAQQNVKYGRSCIEPCLRQLVTSRAIDVLSAHCFQFP